MLAPFAKHGQHARLRTPVTPQTVTPDQHNALMLAFAQDILKYEQAQVNIHFAFIGSPNPCPCDDCNHIEIYPPTFSLRAREEIRKAAQREAQERLAAEMLASASAQGNRKPGQDAEFVSPIPNTERINALADADIALIETFNQLTDAALKETVAA